MQQFQAQWIHPSLSGGVKHRDSVSAACGPKRKAVVAQTSHYNGLLDATKYFDRFDWDVTLHVALYFGFPVALVVLLDTFYRNLSRTFKVAQHFGPWFVATNGFGQGDALTLLIANMLQTVWARMITHQYPFLQLTVYVGRPYGPRSRTPVFLGCPERLSEVRQCGWPRIELDQD